MSPAPPEVRVIGIQGIPEVRPGDDLPALISQAAEAQGTLLQQGDILVVTQKVVSKAEGQLVHLADVQPSAFARQFAEEFQRDPRHVEVVLRESRRIVRMDRGILITETHHGFVCASAGVDISNVPDPDTVCLLPKDPDGSARAIRDGLRSLLGLEVPVIISDTFGRPWREGLTEVAIGVAGLEPLKDYRGSLDTHGHPLRVTVIAVADELANCAELVSGKVNRIPATIVRGYPYTPGEGSSRQLLFEPSRDLFR